MSSLVELIGSTLDLLVPRRCVSCGAYGGAFCLTCRSEMVLPSYPLCWHCGRSLQLVPPVEPSEIPPLCPDCSRGNGPGSLTRLRAIALHEGTTRLAIHALKYQGQRHVARALGDMLARYLQGWANEVDIIIPVPLERQRERERGFNQAALLARRCASQLRLPYLPRALIRQRATRPQVGLSRQDRRENVLHAFVPGRQARLVAGKHVVIIDDVLTTGSTMNAAGAALASLYPSSIVGVAVTRPVPRWLPVTHLDWTEGYDRYERSGRPYL
jgi:ComF family protein